MNKTRWWMNPNSLLEELFEKFCDGRGSEIMKKLHLDQRKRMIRNEIVNRFNELNID